MNNLPICLPCEGIKAVTPLPIFNRPGLSALKYRIGSHGTFFESLLARISTLTAEELGGLSRTVNEQSHRRLTGQTKLASEVEHPLRELLTTREKTDPSIALLDAWSTLADVLTFYQERIANEGFLRTAQERRSIERLAHLTGYRLRPGVSSTVYLAFEVDDTTIQIPFGNEPPTSHTAAPILIPKGTAAKSTPTPGSHDEPQTFETSRELLARMEWNEILPRHTRPQNLRFENLQNLEVLYFNGIGLRLRANDMLAIEYDPQQSFELRRIHSSSDNTDLNTTVVHLQPDSLSSIALLRELQDLANSFNSELATGFSTFVTDIFLGDVKQRFKDTFDACRNDNEGARLAKSLDDVDKTIHDFLQSDLTSASGIRLRAEQIETWAKGISSKLTQSASFGLFDPRQLIDSPGGYRKNCEEIVSRYVDHLNAITDLKSTLDAAPIPVRDRLRIIKQTLADPRLLQTQAQLPEVFLAFDGSELAATTASAVLIPASLDFTSLPGTTAATATVQTVVGSLTAPSVAATDLNGIKSALEILSIATTSPVAQSNILLLTIADGTGIRAAAMRLIRGTATLGVFDEVAIEGTEIYRQGAAGAQPIDQDFSIPNAATAPDKKYWADIQLLGDGTLETAAPLRRSAFHRYKLVRILSTQLWQLVPDDGMMRTLLQFQDALQDVRINNTPGPLRTSVSFIFYDDNIPGSTTPPHPVAAALRDVLFYKETRPATTATALPTFPSVLSRLAQLHTEMCTDTVPNALQKIVACFTDVDSENFPPIINSMQQAIPVSPPGEELSAVTELAESRRNQIGTAPPPVHPFTQLLQNHTVECVEELIDNDRKIAERVRLMLNSVSTAGSDQFKLDSLLTSGSIETPDSPYLHEWRTTNVIARRCADVLSLIATATAHDAATAAESLRDELIASATDNQKRFERLASSFRSIGDEIKKALRTRRLEFHNRLQRIVDGHGKLIPLNPIGDIIQEVLDETEDYDLPIKLHANRVHAHSAPDYVPNPPITPPLLHSFLASSSDSAKTLRLVITGWRKEAERVGNAPKQPALAPADPTLAGAAIAKIVQLFGSSAGLPSVNVFDVEELLSGNPDMITQVASLLAPGRRDFFRDYVRRIRGGRNHFAPKVWAFRSQARLFGWNAPDSSFPGITGVQLAGIASQGVACLNGDPGARQLAATNLQNHLDTFKPPTLKLGTTDDDEATQRMFLDTPHDGTSVGSVVVTAQPGAVETAFRVQKVNSRPRTAYGLSSECTSIALDSDWWTPNFSTIRTTRILCDAEVLVLADAPLEDLISETDASGNVIPTSELILNDVVFDLSVGKHLIVTGYPLLETLTEETAQDRKSGRVVQDVVEINDIDYAFEEELVGDRFCTRIVSSKPLSNIFRRTGFRIYANVVEATHGETQRETLGSGNAAAEFQKFLLKRADVSQLVAPTVTGVTSALAVRVNDVEWAEKPDLKDAGRLAEQFVTRTDDAQQTMVVFGDGVNGARVPTGVENIRVEYRTGLGRKGNVGPGQISQLLGAPLGVKKVNNPLAAQGGANPESRDDARSHAPLAVTAMDRLVSVQDFADFAMTYAGIGKASASLLQGTVHVTIAGLDPESLGEENPLYRNLQQAMSLFGDPSQQFELHDREASLLMLIAKVKIDPKRQWEIVQPKIRAALLQRFHYDRSELGQDLLLSDAIATIQKVEGVLYVDVDKFDAVRQQDVSSLATLLGCLQRRPRLRVNLARVTSIKAERDELGLSGECREKLRSPSTGNGGSDVGGGNGTGTPESEVPEVRPAQLCYLTPDIPDTLILEAVR